MRSARIGLCLLAIAAAAAAAGCGGVADADRATSEGAAARADGRELGRYGIHAVLPDGWSGRISRGTLHTANFHLPPDVAGWPPEHARSLAPSDILVVLFENEPRRQDPTHDASQYEPLAAALQLTPNDFAGSDGVTEDSAASGHGFARRLFSSSSRFFVLFVESGTRQPDAGTIAALNRLHASLRIEAGDFYPGTVEPAEFSGRDGWYSGTSGSDEVRGSGNWVTSWASTVPYADEWNALPPRRTLERLGRDGVLIWIALERNNRFPPASTAAKLPTIQPPFELGDFERHAGWEGQILDIPEYVLWGGLRGEYHVDLRVYFGRTDPSTSSVAEANAMLAGLRLPRWGPWEVG